MIDNKDERFHLYSGEGTNTENVSDAMWSWYQHIGALCSDVEHDISGAHPQFVNKHKACEQLDSPCGRHCNSSNIGELLFVLYNLRNALRTCANYCVDMEAESKREKALTAAILQQRSMVQVMSGLLLKAVQLPSGMHYNTGGEEGADIHPYYLMVAQRIHLAMRKYHPPEMRNKQMYLIV